jgi:hypothetical protein
MTTRKEVIFDSDNSIHDESCKITVMNSGAVVMKSRFIVTIESKSNPLTGKVKSRIVLTVLNNDSGFPKLSFALPRKVFAEIVDSCKGKVLHATTKEELRVGAEIDMLLRSMQEPRVMKAIKSFIGKEVTGDEEKDNVISSLAHVYMLAFNGLEKEHV